jgi:hypothetical protein
VPKPDAIENHLALGCHTTGLGRTQKDISFNQIVEADLDAVGALRRI